MSESVLIGRYVKGEEAALFEIYYTAHQIRMHRAPDWRIATLVVSAL